MNDSPRSGSRRFVIVACVASGDLLGEGLATELRRRFPGCDLQGIGGDRMAVGNLEYIWTFQKDLGLAVVPFVDTGFNIDAKTMGDDWDKYIVASTGLELRWRSPMGDLRIAYGIPLVQDYDKEMPPGRIEFSMGQFF